MKKSTLIGATVLASLAVLSTGAASPAQNKYAPKVPNGLGIAEFRGYEGWPVIASSQNGDKIAVIVGNAVMINAYKSGISGNSKAFPDGSRMAKIHWIPRKNETAPGAPTVPGALHDVDFMVKGQQAFRG
jgi:hypothetical protein